MKYVKPYWLIILILALFFGLSGQALADEPATPTFRLVCGDGIENGTVKVELWLKDNPGLSALAFGLLYDSDYLVPLSYETNIAEAYRADEDWDEGDPPPNVIEAANLENSYFDPTIQAHRPMVSYTLISYPEALANPAAGDDLVVTFYFRIIATPAGRNIPLSLVKYATNSWLKDGAGKAITPLLDLSDPIRVMSVPLNIGEGGSFSPVAGEDNLYKIQLSIANYEDSAVTNAVLIVAAYDAGGRMLGCKLLPNISIGANATYTPAGLQIGLSGGTIAYGKAFLMGGGAYKPLCPGAGLSI